MMQEQKSITVTFFGRLKDLQLGNAKNGIPTDLITDEDIKEYGDKAAQCMSSITDVAHYGCIDGRRIISNADGSKPEVRGRQVGGTGILLESIIDGDSPVVAASGDPLSIIEAGEEYLETVLGVKPSSHSGGCGGVMGAVQDAESIAEKELIANATKAIMMQPQVLKCSGISFSAPLMERVRNNSRQTIALLKTSEWNGNNYVEHVYDIAPEGLEVLETKEDEFHGHQEPAIILILSETDSWDEGKAKALGIKDPFVIGIKQSRDVAHALAGERGDEGVQQIFITNIAKHVAVADRLPSPETPVYIVTA